MSGRAGATGVSIGWGIKLVVGRAWVAEDDGSVRAVVYRAKRRRWSTRITAFFKRCLGMGLLSCTADSKHLIVVEAILLTWQDTKEAS